MAGTSIAATTYQDYIEAKLLAAISTTTTTGVTVKVKQVNGTTPTWPTAFHRLKIVQRTATGIKVEKVEVAAGTTQSGQTVTLGTLTRALSLSDGTNYAGSVGTAQSFSAGADVFMAWDNHDAAGTIKLDIANTFSALQTFTGGIAMSGNTTAIKVPSMTTANAPTPADNGKAYYDTTLGQWQFREAGSWKSLGLGAATPNAADGTGGKVDIATAAEVAAGTATDASSGALNVIPVSICKPTSTGAVSGTIPALGTDVLLDTTIGGTKKGSFTAYTVLCGGTTATGALQNVASVGTAGQFLRSGGAGTLPAFAALTHYTQPVYIGASSSTSIGASSTATLDFDTHTYTIPANDLIAGVSYEIEGVVQVTWVAGTSNVSIKLGSTNFDSVEITPTGTPTGTFFRSIISGTAAAGASVAVRHCYMVTNTGVGLARAQYMSSNFATNGTLAIKISHTFGTNNAGHGAVLQMLNIKKISTTAF